MKSHLLFLLISISLIGNSKSFRSLSSIDPIEISFVSETEGYRNVHLLAINKSNIHNEVPLKIEYIINSDTLTDYSVLKETIREDVKTVFLLEGDSLKILLSVVSFDSIEVKIKGNITTKEPLILDVSNAKGFKYFNGNYWDVKQPCVFRIIKGDSVPEKLKLKFYFNENFHFDKFYFQVNIISPDSSFTSIESNFSVNLNPFLFFESKILESIEDFDLKFPGKYFIEIVPLMGVRVINGINYTSYQRVEL